MDYRALPDYKQDFIRTHSSYGTRADPKFSSTTGFGKSTTIPEKPKLGMLTKTTATNDIWHTTSYSKPEWRSHLQQSFYKKEFGEQQHHLSPEVNREAMKFNRRRTRISEYSNALYNSRVFTNARFTSC